MVHAFKHNIEFNHTTRVIPSHVDAIHIRLRGVHGDLESLVLYVMCIDRARLTRSTLGSASRCAADSYDTRAVARV